MAVGLIDFNPRIRVGCDIENQNNLSEIIHFNPRIRVGCDGNSNQFGLYFDDDFNPRIRVGCDIYICFSCIFVIVISIHASA